jgi:hypothetical protein
MSILQGQLNNTLLRLLEPEAFRRIVPHLTGATLHRQDVLYRPGQVIRGIYFPETAVIVQMALMSNGQTIETATVGHEGASWISASLGHRACLARPS